MCAARASASDGSEQQGLLREQRPTMFQWMSRRWLGFRSIRADSTIDEDIPHLGILTADSPSPMPSVTSDLPPLPTPRSCCSNQSSSSISAMHESHSHEQMPQMPQGPNRSSVAIPDPTNRPQPNSDVLVGEDVQVGREGPSTPAILPRPISLQRALQMFISRSRRSSGEGTSAQGPSATVPEMNLHGENSGPSSEEGTPKRNKEKRGSSARHTRTGKGMSHSSSGLPMCLICLEPLQPEDFESGEALSLECQCRGETALRHKSCAMKWVRVKGDLICDICRSPIHNLPPPPPQSDAAENSEDNDEGQGSWLTRFPGATDVFDCIRMTWVVTIVCILFFEFSITMALFTGMIVAVLYTLSCQIMRCLYNRNAESRAPSVTGPGHAVADPALIGAGVV